MPDYYLETSSEILGDTRKPQKKKTSVGSVLLKILLITVFAISIAASATLIYVKVAYPNPVYINGMSMYPTFNVNGKTTSVDRLTGLTPTSQRYLNYLDRGESTGDVVDYGFASSSVSIKDLSRFDIVVTYYRGDFDSLSSTSPHSGAVAKIKRLIGLPGETITLTCDGTPMGSLSVNGTVVKQPYSQSEYDAPLKRSYGEGKYTYPPMTTAYKNTAGTSFATYTFVLGKSGTPGTSGIDEDEYYVIGDNRTGTESSDCRDANNGVGLNGGGGCALPSYYLSAKLLAIIGFCTLKAQNQGCDLIYNSVNWLPWTWTKSWKGQA
jgi:signal peptidase I